VQLSELTSQNAHPEREFLGKLPNISAFMDLSRDNEHQRLDIQGNRRDRPISPRNGKSFLALWISAVRAKSTLQQTFPEQQLRKI
jgi:hypothetical protein